MIIVDAIKLLEIGFSAIVAVALGIWFVKAHIDPHAPQEGESKR